MTSKLKEKRNKSFEVWLRNSKKKEIKVSKFDFETQRKVLKKKRIWPDYLVKPVKPVIRSSSDQSDQSDGSIRIIREPFNRNPDDPFFDRIGWRIERISLEHTRTPNNI